MNALKSLNLALRFLLELAVAGILAWWGFAVGRGVWRVLLAVGLPFLAGVAWGLFVAPRARVPRGRTTRVAVEAVVFAAATLALVGLGERVWALVFAIVYAANRFLLHEWHQEPTDRRPLPIGGPPQTPGIPEA